MVAFADHAAPVSAAQDSKAVEHATELRKRGASADEVVAELTKAYGLDAVGVAQVLARVDVPAGETLTALERAFRMEVTAAAAALAKGGYAAGPTATALAERRVAPAAAGAVLRGARYAAEEAVPALVGAYRLAVADASVPLRDAGYAIDDVARGLRRAPGASSADVVASLQLADFDPQEVRRVAVDVLRIPAGEYAVTMKDAGASVLDVAQVLKDDYGLAAAPGGDVLIIEARFSGYETISAFRLVWQLDVHEAYQAMQEMTMGFNLPYAFLEGGGYEVPPPTIHGYRIADYRPGHSGQALENVGVVDPDKVTPIAPDPWHGEVEILVGYRDMDELTVTLSGRAGEILGREPHTFQEDGITYQGEWLRVRFRDFDSGYLRLERLANNSARPADALAFHLMDAELIEGPLASLVVALGDPVGEGAVTMPAGTYGGIAVSERTIELEVPAHEQDGLVANVVDLASSNVSVTTRPAGDGVVQIEVKVSFEESGAEVQGTFLGSVPFEADLTSPSLTIAITIGPEGTSGAFAAYSALPEFSADVVLRTVLGGVSVGPIRDWILGQVNTRLLEAFQEMDLGGTIVQALEMGRATLGWGSVRGIYVLDDGRWFIDAKH